MKPKTPIITVFGSSRPRENEAEYRTAYAVGKLLALAGFTVCNGGYNGTMEASAHGAKDAGGNTIGIVSKFFSPTANRFIDRAIVTDTLLDRLSKLVEMGDAYVILKGGTGTLVEMAIVWEYMNKRVMPVKPIVAFADFWSQVVNRFKQELAFEGKDESTKYVTLVSTPEECVATLKQRLL